MNDVSNPYKMSPLETEQRAVVMKAKSQHAVRLTQTSKG